MIGADSKLRTFYMGEMKNADTQMSEKMIMLHFSTALVGLSMQQAELPPQILNIGRMDEFNFIEAKKEEVIVSEDGLYHLN